MRGAKGKKKLSLNRALIVCNGELQKSLINKFTVLNKPQKQLEIIAADGASDFLCKNKILPDVIIGDLDSISPSAKKYFTGKNVKIRRIIDQNRNDLEKCIGYAIDNGFIEISVVGFSGDRFDHTINNLSILKKFHRKANIKVYDRDFEYFFINKNIEFECKPGDVLSLIALPKAKGITTKGLKYPLNNETLEFGVKEGALNSAALKTVAIKYQKGYLLVIKQHNKNFKLQNPNIK